MPGDSQEPGLGKGGGLPPSAATPEGVLRFLAHLPTFVRLYWRLLQDPRVRLRWKAALLGACLYVVSPVDLIPDFALPLLGQLDDLAIFLLAARGFIRNAPREVVLEHLERIERGE